jgi:hypothetical protein
MPIISKGSLASPGKDWIPDFGGWQSLRKASHPCVRSDLRFEKSKGKSNYSQGAIRDFHQGTAGTRVLVGYLESYRKPGRIVRSQIKVVLFPYKAYFSAITGFFFSVLTLEVF